MACVIKNMRCYFLILLFSFILFAENTYATDSETRIVFVDENDKAFNAEIVRWWYSGQRGNKVELKCVDDRCDERLLKQGWSDAIIVAANTTVVEPGDDSCWKLYYGEALLDSPVQEIKIVMRYKNKICR